MPLRATINNQTVMAPFLTDIDWQGLKKETKKNNYLVILPCCNSKGYLRTSKLGLNHFVHMEEDLCNWQKESPQHLKSKNEVAIAMNKLGYDVSTEFIGEDWIADVYAFKGKVKIAIEIQWSYQTLEETLIRQKKYERDGIRCCWLFKNPPKDLRNYYGTPYKSRKDIPFFQLKEQEDKSFKVLVNNTFINLSEFINLLLSGQIKFSSVLKSSSKQEVEVIIYEKECWKCKEKQNNYILKSDKLSSNCGMEIDYPEDEQENVIIDFLPEIKNVVDEFLKSELGKHLKIGSIREMYYRDSGKKYINFTCYYCGAPFRSLWRDDHTNGILIEEIINMNDHFYEDYDHWCYSENGYYCNKSDF